MDNTRSLMDFPLAALKEAGRLLSAYRDPDRDQTERLGNVISPEYNPDSGLCFLIDNNFNVALFDDQSMLRDWIVCACGNEGFEETVLTKAKQCCVDRVRKSARITA